MLGVFGLCAVAGAEPPPSHHDIETTLDPIAKTLRVRDEYSLPTADFRGNRIEIALAAELTLAGPADSILPAALRQQGVTATRRTLEGEDGKLGILTIEKPADADWPELLVLHLNYRGPLRDAQEGGEKEMDSPPPAVGIVLSGAGYFYAHWHNPGHPERLTFSLTVTTPKDWKIVSQGRRLQETVSGDRKTTVWSTDRPQEEMFLIADRFEEYSQRHGGIHLYAFLREKNPDRAKQYLSAAGAYIDFFAKLFEPYPYSKFALVENALPTGYGMPSFTLMGSAVLRLPFILHTSYPHEILHNWWGNGVYVAPDSGNWSEGLTSYLADHLLTELEGHGDKYRFQEMVKYLNYAEAGRDFPLEEFRYRQDMASQAVGYGKTLMMVHALRRELGDETFLNSLRDFFNERRFRFAGFDDLRVGFEKTSGKSLAAFFDQWTRRAGAPELELAAATVRKIDTGFELTLRVRQKQKDAPFRLRLPVAVWFKSGAAAQYPLTLETAAQTFTLNLTEEPAGVMLDPHHDVFRKLDRREVPPGIGQTYGAEAVTLALPLAGESPGLGEAYRQFAELLTKTNKQWNLDSDAAKILPKQTLWLLGGNNRLAENILPALAEYGVSVTENTVTVAGKEFLRAGHSFIFTVRHPQAPSLSVTWLLSDDTSALPGLARKLPHYGKFGYMVFHGKAPDNVEKGVWPEDRTGLQTVFDPTAPKNIPAPPALADFKPVF